MLYWKPEALRESGFGGGAVYQRVYNYHPYYNIIGNETIQMQQCDAYQITAIRKKHVSMQKNPAYGQVGSFRCS